jgi:2-methylcitrate dehydratase PrpD
MTLRGWADILMRASASADIVGLHVKDTLAAFLAGSRTSEGRGLARTCRAGADRADVAALVSAIARLSECDDIHLASCITPGAVVIPTALAFADNTGSEQFIGAVAAGYAAGLALGTGIGGARALTRGIWPTLFAAPVMAAVTASCVRGCDSERLARAISLALPGPAAHTGTLQGTTRWVLLAQAVAKGIRASDEADAGSPRVDGIHMSVFEYAPALSETGFKPFPIARQGASAVTAFQRLLAKGVDPARIDSIDVFVPEVHMALVTRPVAADDRLSRLCNVGFQLACAALAPESLYDPERAASPALSEFAARVTVLLAKDFETDLPSRWPARVVVKAGAQRFEETVVNAPFDHDAADLPELLAAKWRRLRVEEEELAALSATSDPWPLVADYARIAAATGHMNAMRIIDSHFHWWPRQIFDALCTRGSFPRCEVNSRGGYNYVRRARTSVNQQLGRMVRSREAARTHGWLGHEVERGVLDRAVLDRVLRSPTRRRAATSPWRGTRPWRMRSAGIPVASGRAPLCRSSTRESPSRFWITRSSSSA